MRLNTLLVDDEEDGKLLKSFIDQSRNMAQSQCEVQTSKVSQATTIRNSVADF